MFKIKIIVGYLLTFGGYLAAKDLFTPMRDNDLSVVVRATGLFVVACFAFISGIVLLALGFDEK
jgi:hypothetical protein